jgi:exodeoxyribonuclease VII large subunit
MPENRGEQLDFSTVTPVEDESTALKQRIDALAASRRAAVRDNDAELGSKARTPVSKIRGNERAADEVEEAAAARAFSIAEFYARVRQALSGEFPGDIWIVGEVRSIKESRGHHYFELADEGSERGSGAALEVACWARDWPRVRAQLVEAQVALEPGRVVRVRGRVSVWAGGSKIRFTLAEVDIASLLGGIAAARRKLLAALEQEGLLEANRRIEVPLVPLRIGLVTSPGSEGHNDFAGQLERSGFAFHVVVEPTLVQGVEAPRQIAGALTRLRDAAIDLAVVVRGGGSRGDLAAFDSEDVARAIATSPFPVWTGIGHTGDRSVADEVANRSHITPSQCGESVVARVTEYYEAIGATAYEITRVVSHRLMEATHALRSQTSALSRIVRHELEWKSAANARIRVEITRAVSVTIERCAERLSQTRSGVAAATKRVLSNNEQEMLRRRLVLRAYDPVRQLERGWSLTFGPDGKALRSVVGLSAGKRITTRLRDGEVLSVVDATSQGSARREEAR